MGAITVELKSINGVSMNVRSLDELLFGLASFPPETVTLLVTEAGALAAMFTFNVICG